MLATQSEIADAISTEMRNALGEKSAANVRKTAPTMASSAGYDFYLRGLYFLNKRNVEGLRGAISYFDQAIAKDPGYALAYSGLADAYGVLPSYRGNPSENYPKSNAAARKALLETPLDPERTVVRINAADTDEHARDLDALADTAYTSVMLSKTESAAQVTALAPRAFPMASEAVKRAWGVTRTEDEEAVARAKLIKSAKGTAEAMLKTLTDQLAKGPYLLGERMTAADVLWGTALMWTTAFKLVPELPVIKDYIARIAARPASVKVKAADAALAAEHQAAAGTSAAAH